MMGIVRNVVGEMSLAQMTMIASFINGVAMAMLVIRPVIQMMNVQLNALRTKQCHTEQQAPH
ncbi:MAG TPA: hypothetical protein DD979_02925 [Gammaproteobacteria bacterium]|nr:hypothetical protein [Gammaproteobacteria bacterium]